MGKDFDDFLGSFDASEMMRIACSTVLENKGIENGDKISLDELPQLSADISLAVSTALLSLYHRWLGAD